MVDTRIHKVNGPNIDQNSKFSFDLASKKNLKSEIPIDLMLSTRQASVDDRSKMSKNCEKMSKLWSFMTIFGITMRNAFR